MFVLFNVIFVLLSPLMRNDFCVFSLAHTIFHSEPKVLVSGSDFYAFPRMDPRGERMAWIEWHHPNMPWDKAELWVGYISENG